MNNKMIKTITYGAALALAARTAFAAPTDCLPCPTGYASPQGSGGIGQCSITCQAGTYVAVVNGQCVSCLNPTAFTSDKHTVAAGKISSCAVDLAKKTGGSSAPTNTYKM